jgi:hypothetical protein
MGIDLFFAGLMLICLEGQQYCPTDRGPNTAWVVKVPNKPNLDICKYTTNYYSTLEVRFSPEEFSLSYDGSHIKCGTDTCEFGEGYEPKRLCVNLDQNQQISVDLASLQRLVQIGEIDRRFVKLRGARLDDATYVQTRIFFPTGRISAGPIWHASDRPAWSRSNDDSTGSLPRMLSDRLQVEYVGAAQVTIRACDEAQPLITLTRKQNFGFAEVEIRNRANALSPDIVDGYDKLPYLLPYYRLGIWEDGAECPEYPGSAVVLRCKRISGQRCAQYAKGDRDTTFWPVTRGPEN